MPVFSAKSLAKLAEADPRLQSVFLAAIPDSPVDFRITCGHRGKADQEAAVARGASKVHWPNSAHNQTPAQAVDIEVMHGGIGVWTLLGQKTVTDGFVRALFKKAAVHILARAEDHGVLLRWGGDFNSDGDLTTSDSWDMPHFEIKGWKRNVP